MSPAISIRDAKVRFGHTQALDGVSLDVPARDCFGLVGESGSGKTTLMRTILGLERLTSGSIALFGAPLGTGAAGIRQRSRLVQAIFQDPAASLSPRRRIGQLLDEVGEVLGETREQIRARQRSLFQRLGLPAATLDKYPYQVSGGQARRVAVARALLMRPRILIADEPTAGLDVSVQGDLLNLLQELRADNDLTLVVVSHNLAVVRLIADSAAVMHRGRIVEQGPAAQVFDAPRADYTQRLLASWPRLRAVGA
ncbi:MAG TPA: ATP-binding cassette domain-containing protein [Dongiaceae bacterium]|jgi:peptide/nickel transport system ATP-binding protein|nr:ATP-binding cassette domain-containing protein [Dongiaceae bacterium]